MIIDFHCHIFPDSLAARALSATSDCSGIPPTTDGTLRDTLRLMDQSGVDLAVTLPVCTSAAQHKSVNDFAAGYNGGRFICFGGLFPKSPGALDEAARIHALGLRGVKLHPDYQQFMADDPEVFELYDALQQLGLIAVFHCGWDPVSPSLIHNPPDRLVNVARAFPRLKIVAGHMGGYDMGGEVLRHLGGLPNVWFDTSLSARQFSQQQFDQLACELGPERLVFATDTPWSDPQKEIARVRESTLTPSQQDAIFYKTAQQLLSL